MTKHNCDRCGSDEDARCRQDLCSPFWKPGSFEEFEKSPARLETEASAPNELSREFLLATIVELADAWDKCDGALAMKPDAGVPRFVSVMGVVNTIAFNQGKRV